MNLERFFPLLEGEPDGGTPAPEPKPDPADGQQADLETPIVPAEGASDTPAPADGETPGAEGEATPAEDVWSDDDTWEELRERFPDRFPKPEAKPEATPTALQPRPNPIRESVGQAGREAAGRMHDAVQRFNAGELAELPASFMADVETFGSWTNAEAEGRQLDLAERLLERTLGIDPAKLDEDDPIQVRYGDALAKRAQEHVNAFREFNKLYSEADPAKRNAILARAEQRQATATAAFLLERDALLVEHGKKLGASEKEKEAGKRITRTVETASKNGRTEAFAKAQADVQARRATATAATASKVASGPLTVEEAQTLPIDELIRRTKAQ